MYRQTMPFAANDYAFNSAWVAAMRFTKCREWLFNSSPSHFLSALSNCKERLLLSEVTLYPPTGSENSQTFLHFKTLVFFDHKDENYLLCTGFDAGVDILQTLRFLTPSSCYTSHQPLCCRIAFVKNPSGATDAFRIEFRWYLSGILTILCTTVGMGVTNEALVDTSPFSRFQCRVFAPREASKLRDASVSLHNNISFLEHFIFDVYDTRTESACVYCTYRKHSKCECPVAFRRRHKLSAGVVSSPSPVVWNETKLLLREHVTRGVFFSSWRARDAEDCRAVVDRVMYTGISSYVMSFNTSGAMNLIIQKLVRETSTSMENERMISFRRRVGVAKTSRTERASLLGPKMWQCRECKVVIRGSRGNINAHLAHVHSMIRPFACRYSNCEKRFQTRLNLARHVTSVHEGRPVKCLKCSRSFKTEASLATHIGIAHGDDQKQFKCSACGGCFGRRGTMERHFRNVHEQNST